ncbi:MAG: hypothetical protein ACM3XM_16650 [Mycobacterium leprae]
MARIYFGLSSTEGDRLGHLVRGVQMLRSYGDEAVARGCTDVVDTTYLSDGPPALCCLLECESSAADDALRQMCRETEWALGEEPAVLTVQFFREGDEEPRLPELLQGLLLNQPAPGFTVYTNRSDFAELYDWGQVALDGGTVIGEWPSATGP